MASANFEQMQEALAKHSMGGGLGLAHDPKVDLKLTESNSEGLTDLGVVSAYLMRVIWNALNDRSEFLVYMAIVMNHALVGGLVSMLLAFSVFLYAIPQR